jgi:hypothetical protein
MAEQSLMNGYISDDNLSRSKVAANVDPSEHGNVQYEDQQNSSLSKESSG